MFSKQPIVLRIFYVQIAREQLRQMRPLPVERGDQFALRVDRPSGVLVLAVDGQLLLLQEQLQQTTIVSAQRRVPLDKRRHRARLVQLLLAAGADQRHQIVVHLVHQVDRDVRRRWRRRAATGSRRLQQVAKCDALLDKRFNQLRFLLLQTEPKNDAISKLIAIKINLVVFYVLIVDDGAAVSLSFFATCSAPSS